jgi:hypothetical protein
MWETVTRGRRIAAGVGSVLVGAAAIWQVMTPETVPQFLAKRGIALSVLLWQGTAAVAFALMVWLLYSLIQASRANPLPLQVRRVRRLEYHIAHMVWVRAGVLAPATPEPLLVDARRVIQNHRDILLDLDNGLFPASTKDRFRRPGQLYLTPARATVQNMTHQTARETALADVDQLLDVLRQQWVAESGPTAQQPSWLPD